MFLHQAVGGVGMFNPIAAKTCAVLGKSLLVHVKADVAVIRDVAFKPTAKPAKASEGVTWPSVLASHCEMTPDAVTFFAFGLAAIAR